MHSPTPMSDYLINGMAAMIGERDRRKPVAAYLGASLSECATPRRGPRRKTRSA